MINFKSGLINCIGTIITIPLLILFIIFSSLHQSVYNIVFYTLFGSFSLLYFIFSTLYDWIGNKKAQKIFKRFINIFRILSIFLTYIILVFSNISLSLQLTFTILSLAIVLLITVFLAIWENIPKTLLSISYLITYITFSIFLFFLIFA